MQLADTLLSPRIRILVGDNEDVIAHTLSVILDLAGCAVCAVYLGESASQLLHLLKAKFDLIDLSASTPAVPIACSTPLQIWRCKGSALNRTGQTLQSPAE